MKPDETPFDLKDTIDGTRPVRWGYRGDFGRPLGGGLRIGEMEHNVFRARNFMGQHNFQINRFGDMEREHVVRIQIPAFPA